MKTTKPQPPPARLSSGSKYHTPQLQLPYISWKYLFLGCILVVPFFLWTFFTSFKFLFIISTIVFVFLVLLLGIIITFSVTKPHHRPRGRKFKFLLSSNYHQQFNVPDQIPRIDSNSPIEALLEKLITLVVDQFIESWYGSISPSKLFPSAIKDELHQVVRRFHVQIASVDLSDVIVNRILDIFREHFTYFCQAENLVELKGISSRIAKDSKEYQLAVAQNYNRGKLHKGVNISVDDHRNSGSDLQKEHLRKKVAGLLPILLSQNEASSDLVVSLVREILACTVLSSVCEVVAESDFFNLLIVNFIGANLRRRDQVKKLRAALEEHTRGAKRTNAQQNTKRPMKSDLNNQNKRTSNDLLEKSSVDFPEKNSSGFPQDHGIELGDILGSPRALEAFRSYLLEQGRKNLLDIWEQIESIKSPLEDHENADLSLSLEFSSADDLTKAFEMLTGSTMVVDSEEIELLSQYIHQENFSKARRILFQIQSSLFDILGAELNIFIHSDFFHSSMLSLDHNELETKEDEPIAALDVTEDIAEETEVSPVVFHAVEDAFDEIMKSSKAASKDQFYSQKEGSASFTSLLESVELGPNIPTVPLTLALKKGLFGDDKDLNYEDSSSAPTASRLFEDASDTSDSDSDMDPLSDRETELGDLKVLFAAPGNLKLSEEVVNLDQDIERLSQQIMILTPLLRKAELTHNVTELKILKKAKLGLEREIDSKELQKQQYMVQENENSLYGKSRVQIQSYISGSEMGRDYILYIVEVQRFLSDDPTVPSAGWVVARRFSQFHHLHVYLRKRYPPVEGLKFPKKAVLMLKFQQRQLVEMRKAALEEYLCQLLKLPDVCGDRVFRSFLSSENFSFSRRKKPSLLKSLSSTKGIRPSAKDQAPNKDFPVAGSAVSKLMQNELNQYDSPRAFVKPISDLLITIFDLNSSKGWLRGRALVVILQQVFGTTIENMVRDQEKSIRSETRVHDLIANVTNMLFPNGKFRDPPAVRTPQEKDTTRKEAKALFRAWMDITCSRIFGGGSTNYAHSHIFAMLQNDYLNLHLLLVVFDEIIDAIQAEDRG